jgi:hypothetical protein
MRSIFFLRSLPVILCVFGFATGAPVKLIIDTDFDSDVDDVAALSLAHAFADSGEAEILGVAVVGLHETCAPAVRSQNAFYGRPEIPVGVRRSGGGPLVDSHYTRMLIEKFPAPFDRAAALDAVALYRKLLAAADDQSVVIVSLGHLSNLGDLLDSGADAFSPLSGIDLVKKKVIHYVCMGSEYPQQLKPGTWGNFLPDPKAVIRVNDDWPTPVIYTGGGVFARKVKTGRGFLELPEASLVRQAYHVFFRNITWAKGPEHHSADLIAIYVAVRGTAPYFKETKGGHCHVFENGTMEWRAEPTAANRSYVADLTDEAQGVAAAAKFEELIVAAERKRLAK